MLLSDAYPINVRLMFEKQANVIHRQNKEK